MHSGGGGRSADGAALRQPEPGGADGTPTRSSPPGGSALSEARSGRWAQAPELRILEGHFDVKIGHGSAIRDNHFEIPRGLCLCLCPEFCLWLLPVVSLAPCLALCVRVCLCRVLFHCCPRSLVSPWP